VTAPGPHLGEDDLVDLLARLNDEACRADRLRHLERCVPCERRLLAAWREAERAGVRARIPVRLLSGRGWEEPVPARRRALPALAAIAVLVAVLATAALVRFDRGPGPLDAWLPIESEPTLLRSADPAEDEVYAEARAAYARHDARRVVELLGSRTIPPAHEPMTLMLASALLLDGRAAEARSRLEAMDVPTLPQPARDRARFTLAAALLREGHVPEARAQLARLSDSPEFSERARAALARLGGR
jgi:hypothetical protein